MKIYVVGGSVYYTDFLKNVELVDSPKEAQVILFTGGEDVDPSIYGCEKHPKTHSNLKRDLKEKEIFESVSPNQLCVGICRGSQFLCCMNGGILVQDCNHHACYGTHPITNGGLVYEITSTHHQMQYPFKLESSDYDLLYWAAGISAYHEGDGISSRILDQYEPEIVLYHKKGMPKCLAIQGHPEMMPNSPVADMLNNLIQNLVANNETL